MHQLIEQHGDALAAICRRYRVRRLDVFGSAASGDFDQQGSDLDFVVEFREDLPDVQRFDTYFGLREELEALFGRSVDLVEPGGLRNPYFLRRLNQTRERVYAA